jgi:oxalate---CoA ligase
LKRQLEFSVTHQSSYARFGTHTNIESLVNYFKYLTLGGTVYFCRTLSVSRFVKMLMSSSISDVVLPALAVIAIEEYLRKHNETITNVAIKHVQVIGASVHPDILNSLRERWPTLIYNSYGTKEVSGIADRRDIPQNYKPNSIGKLKTKEVKIIEGEICVLTGLGFAGYEDFDNTEVFYDDYFRTGDMGYLDDEGFLFITGRIKEMINLGGEKISPYEVEAAINTHANVFESVAFPIPNELGYDDLALAISLKDPSQKLNLLDVRAYLIQQFSPQKLPRKVMVLDAIPRNGGEKINRKTFYAYLKQMNLL